MSGGNHLKWGGTAGPLPAEDDRDSFDSSVSAVSFGLVATAVLISMFLVMAIFERFLRRHRPQSPANPPSEALYSLNSNYKLPPFPSPKMGVCLEDVSVLMPGDEVPRFIAQLAPVPCPSLASTSST